LGAISAVMVPVPYLFNIYGPKIRSWSKYAASEEQRNKSKMRLEFHLNFGVIFLHLEQAQSIQRVETLRVKYIRDVLNPKIAKGGIINSKSNLERHEQGRAKKTTTKLIIIINSRVQLFIENRYFNFMFIRQHLRSSP
jgi:hypothetical protein